jgi:Asp-tRNA(Asn)/Glu-tRNA(Gln) amidotransferase A subunit family amidase
MGRIDEPPLWRRDARDLVAGLQRKEISAADVAESLLRRVADREAFLKAWAWHEPDLVREQARRLDAGSRDLPLFGVPIGVKDIIDTADMPTSYGSAIYRGHRPARDADVVARLRAAGAVIMGKTATTEFAHAHPCATVHPERADRTPGGSSSGSAAAVADGMVPLALGSQTGGSTIRPAAYCGICGFKPTYEVVCTDGMKPLAPSMDTLGIHARSVGDIELLFSVLVGHANSARPPRPIATPRIGYYPGPHREDASADAACALQECRDAFVRAGWEVQPLALPSENFGELSNANRTIMAYEAARELDHENVRHRAGLSDDIAGLIDQGHRIPCRDYEEALALASRCRVALGEGLHGFDVLMTFSAPGEAPELSAGTGSSVFNRGWTTMGVPCLTVPFGRGTIAGLPLAVQFVAAAGEDFQLLSLGQRVEGLVRAQVGEPIKLFSSVTQLPRRSVRGLA